MYQQGNKKEKKRKAGVVRKWQHFHCSIFQFVPVCKAKQGVRRTDYLPTDTSHAAPSKAPFLHSSVITSVPSSAAANRDAAAAFVKG